MNRPRILVTNDDGIFSEGLWLLYESVRDLGEIIVIAPETSKTATGLSLTINEPLRLLEVEYRGIKVYLTNGSPCDAVNIARELFSDIDLVVVGVNIGENTSLQNILASATVGAAFEAALHGIPGVAFSANVKRSEELLDPTYREIAMQVIKHLTLHVLKRGLPKDVDVLNVNFPNKLHRQVKVKLVPPARMRFIEKLEKRVDVRGREYYWLYGVEIEPTPNTDTYVVVYEGNIAVTPLSLNLSPVSREPLNELNEIVREIEKKLIQL